MKTELERINARNHLVEAVLEYCRVFFHDDDKDYNEKFVAGVMAFLHVNYYGEMYRPVVGVEDVTEEKRWWQFWKRT